MKKIRFRSFALLLVSVFWGLSLSVPSLIGAEIDFSGRIKLFNSLYLNSNHQGPYFFHDAGEFALKRLEARFVLSGELSSSVSFYTRVDTYTNPDLISNSTPFPEATSLGVPSSSEPFQAVLYEGFIKISGFLFNQLDLTIGKQRITWGTADKMNVVDNLNPIDLANFLSFDPDYFAERRPQFAFNWELYLGSIHKLQLVWLLSRQYAPLPPGFTRLLNQSYDFSGVNLIKAKNTFQNTNFGFRYTTVVANFDLGVSFYRGNQHLPVITGVELGPPNQIFSYFSYPRENIFGFDLAGELKNVGLWAETAIIFPEEVKGFVVQPVLVGGKPFLFKDEFDLFQKNYFRFVVGFDYTFDVGSGLYLNGQYLHGFFDERAYAEKARQIFGLEKGMFFGELEDYFILRGEYKLFREALKLQLGSMMEFSGEKRAVVFLPQIEWKIKDLILLQVGSYLTNGAKEGTKFGLFSRDKVVYLSLKLDF